MQVSEMQVSEISKKNEIMIFYNTIVQKIKDEGRKTKLTC